MNVLRRLTLAARFVAQGPRARYEGARGTPNRSLLPGVVQSARMDVNAIDRAELVRKSRYFEKNNAFVNRLADLFEQYTVGQGLAFFPASSDDAWNARALGYWRDWQKFADLSSRLSFGTLQGIIARSLFVDGEIFILLTSGETGNPRIQLIESHRVRTPSRERTNASIIDGIEVDARGRPIAYHIAVDSDTREERFSRADAQFVVHVFEPGRPGQMRGLPALYPVLNDLHDLDDLQVFEMQAAKEAAQVTNVIKTATGELDDSDLIRGTVTGSDDVDRDDYYRDVFGGRAKVLKHGDEFSQFQITRPAAATSGYWDYLTAKICAGVGIPKEIVLPSSMQGTSIRSVLDVANAFFRARSAVIADHFRRVYEYVIEVSLGNEVALRPSPADWYRSTYRSPRAINVDVGRNSAAAVAEFKCGMRTLQSIYAETGEDWREQLRQKAAEIAFAQQLATEFGIERAEIMTLDPNELSSNNAAAAAEPSAP
jgi:lambda family phage portal protein